MSHCDLQYYTWLDILGKYTTLKRMSSWYTIPFIKRNNIQDAFIFLCTSIVNDVNPVQIQTEHNIELFLVQIWMHINKCYFINFITRPIVGAIWIMHNNTNGMFLIHIL